MFKARAEREWTYFFCPFYLLLYAPQGLVTPLPEGWKPCAAPSGELYYFNFDTGESVWEHPGDEYYRNLVDIERAKMRAGSERPGSA